MSKKSWILGVLLSAFLSVAGAVNLANAASYESANSWDVNFIFEDRNCPYEIVYQSPSGAVLAEFVKLISNFDSDKKKWGVRCFYRDKRVLE